MTSFPLVTWALTPSPVENKARSRSFWPPQDSGITHSSAPSLVKFNKGDTKWKEGLIPLYSPARI